MEEGLWSATGKVFSLTSADLLMEEFDKHNSFRTVHRYPSKVGAVCVNALVRFCAGGDQ